MQASSPSRAAHPFQTLPIIDVSPLFGSDSSRIDETIVRLKRAASQVGFLYVTQHGIAPQLILDLERVAREFFALPPALKLEYHIGRSRNHRGYVPPASPCCTPRRPGSR